MKWLQDVIVRLDVGLGRRIFTTIYAMGVRRAVAAVASHPEVHSIYGCGSYFEGRHLCGHSDVDLCIVLQASVSRGEGIQYRLAQSYNRVRRFFPFLGAWAEKEANLIFLEEVEAGFPLPASFSIRKKRGRLHHLYGAPFPEPIDDKPLTISELLNEIDTLVRLAVLQRTLQAKTLLFWKRMFSKMHGLTEELGLLDVAKALRADPALGFLAESDRLLFIGKCTPAPLCRLFLTQVQHVQQTLLAHEVSISLPQPQTDIVTSEDEAMPLTRCKPEHDTPSVHMQALIFAAGANVHAVHGLPSFPIGFLPHLFYFPLDSVMPIVELHGDVYDGLRLIWRAIARHGETGDALVVCTDVFTCLFSRQDHYIEMVPLNPILHANFLAYIRGQQGFRLPRAVYREQQTEAAQLYQVLQKMYAKHTNWLPKTAYHCLYREDDLETISNALQMMRAYLTNGADQRCPQSTEALVASLQRRHPTCQAFLQALLAYYRFLTGSIPLRPTANNLYVCLHQFMAQFLAGDTEITLDDHHQHLGITVGIITRNRAADLPEALESLCRQTRPAEEVLIVDNGSTDDTKAVVERFRHRLPLHYLYLEEASIPKARNLVLEHATHEIIAFTDDDAACDVDWLGGIERGFLRAKNIGIVGGWVEHWPVPYTSIIDTYYETFHNHKP